MNSKKITFILIISIAVLVVFSTYMLFVKKQQKESFIASSSAICPNCNVVLITMTNLRYDHMSIDGYDRQTTPNLDAFAKKSLIFDNAFSHVSWTLPEGISIYTSLYPFQHGVMDRYNGGSLSPKTPTIIDTLKEYGYTTAAFTGGFDYNPAFGLTSRFDHYEECSGGEDVTYPRQNGPAGSANSEYGQLTCSEPKAEKWLATNKNKKFFIHLQGFDAHCPFSQAGGKTFDPNYQGSIDYSSCLQTFDKTQPQIINGQPYYQVFSPDINRQKTVLLGPADIHHLLAIYDEAILHSDAVIENFLQELNREGLMSHTVVIFTSEHGDMFGKYGRFMRGGPIKGTFYDDVLHIPLIIYYPKVAPKRINGLVQQIDLAPTLFDILGITNSFHMEGKSLLPLINYGQEINKYIFAGASFNSYDNPVVPDKSRSEVIRSLQWKIIEETSYGKSGTKTTEEFYNIAKDKEELNPLPPSGSTFNILHGKLDKWLRKMGFGS